MFAPKQFDPEKAAAAIEGLRGSFGCDGHEVDHSGDVRFFWIR
jgi:hypothetical protein